ncbi:MAG TPA: CHAT domain-containing tetratricopeptide repeat protein [Chryseosolibacter sp.]|nr:CHAT domain-containing tetratricopeptide repeat protein [Chryseosolibacter sp.]
MSLRTPLALTVMSLLLSLQLIGQTLPVRDNKTDAQNLRQGSWIIYFNSSWKEIDQPDKAAYYRLISYSNDLPVGIVADYFRNGIKQWEGNLLKDRPEVYEGKQTWYYDNKKIKSEAVFKNGEFVSAKSFLRDGSVANENWTQEYYDPGVAAFEQHDDLTAIRYFEQCLPNIEAMYERESEEYVDVLVWLSLLYWDKDESKWLKSKRDELQIYRAIRQPGDPDLLDALFELGRFYHRRTSYKEAEEFFQEYLSHEATFVTGYHGYHGWALSTLGEICMETQRYPLAVEKLEEAIAHYSKNPPSEPLEIDLAKTRMMRARTLTGEWTEGKKLLLQELSQLRNNPRATNEAYLGVYSGLGNFCRMNGQLKEAESWYLKGIDNFESEPEKDLIHYISLTVPLAEVYEHLGLPHKADKYIELSRSVFNKANTEQQGYYEAYVAFLKRLVTYYNTLGKQQQSEETLVELRTTSAKAFGKNSLEYVYAINAESEYFIRKNESLKEYIDLLHEGDGVIVTFAPERLSSTDVRTAAKLYQLLGTAYYLADAANTGQLVKAEQFLNRSEQFYNLLPEQGFIPEMVDVNIMRASISEVQGKTKEADHLYSLCLSTIKKHFGEDHVYYANILFAIGKKSEVRSDITQSQRYYREALQKQNAYLKKIFPYLSGEEKESFYQANVEWISNFQSFASLHNDEEPSLRDDLYNLQLSNKGVVLQSLNTIAAFIREKGDKQLIALYDEWRKEKNELVKAYQRSLTSPAGESGWKEIEAKVNQLERDISSRSSEFARFVDTSAPSWKNVQRFLGENEAAVEITYIPRQINDDTVYVAMVIRKNIDHPIIVTLMPAKEAEGRALKFYRNAILLKLEDTKSYDIYWKPLEKSLEGVSKIYFSGDGVYHQVSIATLLNPVSKKYIGDETTIHVVPGTIVLTNKRLKPVYKNAVVFAHPDFGRKTNVSTKKESRSLDLENITDLPGTDRERIALQSIFSDNNVSVKDYSGMSATEESLKAVSNPAILHIATHGFFFSNLNRSTNENEYGFSTETLTANPLLRSGLLLAGCRESRTDGVEEDGILTAFEASTLPLQQTSLVVLSACETGLGEVKNGEGVFGLQRAFFTAGARQIMMSLWKVDDDATQYFMVSFYDALFKLQDTTLAFNSARSAVKEKYKSPYYWGAFVLTGI